MGSTSSSQPASRFLTSYPAPKSSPLFQGFNNLSVLSLYFLLKMDPNDIALTMVLLLFVLESEREKKRLRAAQLELEEKQRELSLLKRKKQRILAEEAAKQNLVDDFMVFIEAIENDNLEIVQNFDENSIMNSIETMLSSDGGGDNGGFPADYGDTHTQETVLNLEQTSPTYAAVATVNGSGSCGSDTGAFAIDSGDAQSTNEQAGNDGF